MTKLTLSALLVFLVGVTLAPLVQRFTLYVIPPGSNYRIAAFIARLLAAVAPSQAVRDEATDALGEILASDPRRLPVGEVPLVDRPLAVLRPVISRCIAEALLASVGLPRLTLSLLAELGGAVSAASVPFAQASFVASTVAGLALFGEPLLALAAAGAVATAAVALHVSYGLGRRRFGSRGLPPLRRTRDKGVLVSVMAAAGAPTAVAVGVLTSAPLAMPAQIVVVTVGAAALAGSVVFISTLCDWYFVLPRVAGLVTPAPCQSRQLERRLLLTAFWYFHRAVAMMVVAIAIFFVPAYEAASTTGRARMAWEVAVLFAAAAGGFGLRNSMRGAYFALNPPLAVGDIVHGTSIGRDGDYYVVDISLAGVKLRRLGAAPFVQQADCTIDCDQLRRARPLHSSAPCASGCVGVNWYCCQNSARRPRRGA